MTGRVDYSKYGIALDCRDVAMLRLQKNVLEVESFIEKFKFFKFVYSFNKVLTFVRKTIVHVNK